MDSLSWNEWTWWEGSTSDSLLLVGGRQFLYIRVIMLSHYAAGEQHIQYQPSHYVCIMFADSSNVSCRSPPAVKASAVTFFSRYSTSTGRGAEPSPSPEWHFQPALLLSLLHCYLSCHMFTSACDLHSLAIVLEDCRQHMLSEGPNSTRLPPQFLLPQWFIYCLIFTPSEAHAARNEDLL